MTAERILVTGATGFTGSHLCERLSQEGNSVRALVRDLGRCDGLHGSGIELIRGDLRDPQSLEETTKEIDVVYHIAALFRPEE